MARSRSKLTYGHREPDPVEGRAWVEVGDGHFAVVDAEDWDRVRIFRWSLDPKGEPKTQYALDGGQTSAQLKMVVIGERAKKGFAIKNLDGDPLNCCRDNVRMVTLSEARRIDRETLGPVIKKKVVRKNNTRHLMDMGAADKRTFKLAGDPGPSGE